MKLEKTNKNPAKLCMDHMILIFVIKYLSDTPPFAKHQSADIINEI